MRHRAILTLAAGILWSAHVVPARPHEQELGEVVLATSCGEATAAAHGCNEEV